MNLKSKILKAINKGLNEALDLDEFDEDDLKIQKKSLGTIIKDSNYNNLKYSYQNLMNQIMSKNIYFISKEDIDQCINWYKKYEVLYNPYLDGQDFKNFIHDIIKIYGNDVNLNFIDTSEVTDMSTLFDNSSFNGNISDWDVSNVTNMWSMFAYSKFNGDISSWDISSVTDIRWIFYHSIFNGDISKWNVSNIKDMHNMFRGSLFNGDISNWDVSNVKDMDSMFRGSKFNRDISSWNVSKVEDTFCMFADSKFTKNISNWNLSSCVNSTNMFGNCHINQKYKPKGIK